MAIKVGTASWTDKTLLASGWYPKGSSGAEERLKYYASRFPIVEVDSTYYTPPSEQNAKLWAERTPDEFLFNIKAYALFTQHPARVASVYKDLRPETTKKNVYLKDFEESQVTEIWERFLSALGPLEEAGKLGPILFQFPQWFYTSTENREYILKCQERCAPRQICIEFRSQSWLNEKNRDRTLDFLRSYRLPYVVVDMPQGYRSSVPPVIETTAPLSVVRFHGHSEKWESKDIYERFGYEYSEDELKGWVKPVEQLAKTAENVHVLFNNCYRNYAQVNAQELIELLPDVVLNQ